MCRRGGIGMDLITPINLSKLTVLLAFLLFAECAAGSCLSYGHSCWGAHGKRSGGSPSIPKYIDSNRLLLARLIQQNQREELDNERGMKEYENPPPRAEIQQLLNDAELESNPLKGLNEYDPVSDILLDENLSLLEEFPTTRLKSSGPRRISSRILKKRSTKTA